MSQFHQFIKINQVIISCTLVAFAFQTIPSLDAIPMGVNANDTQFTLSIDKLIKKIILFKNTQDLNKLLETLIDLKIEVEKYTGHKVNLDKQLAQVEKEIKVKGGRLDNAEMKTIREIIKKKEKRGARKAKFMAFCLEYQLPYDPEEEWLHFIAKADDDFNEEESAEFFVPIQVSIGVSVALCGLILSTIPLSAYKQKGANLKQMGIKMAIS